MKIIGCYQGKLGEIAIWENEKDGNRFYLEGDNFQSHGSPDGESKLGYVKMMEGFLNCTQNVLVLGCGGGNIATMLARAGKTITVVDFNPVSFHIAHEYFGMPNDITCITDDFRNYLRSEVKCFDGIAIDVGGPGFRFEEQFDRPTCYAIKKRLSHRGRVVTNILVGSDFDPITDMVGNYLQDDYREAWIFDRPGTTRRNALVFCLPKVSSADLSNLFTIGDVPWIARRPCRRARNVQPPVISIRRH